MAKADRGVPPGHVLVRLDDLAALIAGRASAPDVSAWEVLASVIAIVSARRSGPATPVCSGTRHQPARCGACRCSPSASWPASVIQRARAASSSAPRSGSTSATDQGVAEAGSP